jgi:hypothetical protein
MSKAYRTRQLKASSSLEVVLKPPVLRGGSFEAKANFGSGPLLFTEVDDLAILFLTVDDISQDDLPECRKPIRSGKPHGRERR